MSVPDQQVLEDEAQALAFLHQHARIVIKPARGEQGNGVHVDLQQAAEVRAAFAGVADLGETVLGEQYVSGQDLRIIVIDGEMVAAAIRKPAMVLGDGEHSVRALIESQSRRRAAATQGESRIPLDAETRRCLDEAGFGLDDIPYKGEQITVRKTANLHTGGTIHDVTRQLHPDLAAAAVAGAQALDMPLVGFDFIVADVDQPDYVIIEANERPGLANHEPQPTAERFIDMLFPQTTSRTRSHHASPGY
ncbi:MAG: hypothetical protein R3E95_06510 [Thiolinea sp.]